MKSIILSISVLLSACSFAQSTVIEGNYSGKNIYIQNPLSSDENYFCVKRIEINGEGFEIKTDAAAFEIDLKAMELEVGTPIKIELFHSHDCKPSILNGGCLMPSIDK